MRSFSSLFVILAIACRVDSPDTSFDDIGHNLDDTAAIDSGTDTADSGMVEDGDSCHLLVGWDLDAIYPDGFPTVRLSYEAGATAAEAKDGNEWQQDFKMVQSEEGGSIITLVAFPIYATSPSPVLPGSTVRFQFDADVDGERNGNEVPSDTDEGTLGSIHASQRYENDDGSEIIAVYDLTVSTYEAGGEYFNEVTLPACELE